MTLRSALTCLVLPTTLLLGACDGDKKADAAPASRSKDDSEGTSKDEPGSKPSESETVQAKAPDEAPETAKPKTSADAEADNPSGNQADTQAGEGDALMADASETEGEAQADAPAPAAGGVHVFAAIESRDESLIPSDTPQDRKDDYLGLPVKRGDGTPVGAIGPDGTHLDDFVIGRGFTKGRCDEAADTFYTDGDDDRVNVCLRIVHKPVEETVTVKWIKDGRPPRKTEVKVKPIHAYRTRAWLPIKGNRRGEWEAVIEASDGTELARGRFTVK